VGFLSERGVWCDVIKGRKGKERGKRGRENAREGLVGSFE
jgi:uncharacterized Zn finger protein